MHRKNGKEEEIVSGYKLRARRKREVFLMLKPLF
jgi:hypothetical protein